MLVTTCIGCDDCIICVIISNRKYLTRIFQIEEGEGVDNLDIIVNNATRGGIDKAKKVICEGVPIEERG